MQKEIPETYRLNATYNILCIAFIIILIGGLLTAIFAPSIPDALSSTIKPDFSRYNISVDDPDPIWIIASFITIVLAILGITLCLTRRRSGVWMFLTSTITIWILNLSYDAEITRSIGRLLNESLDFITGAIVCLNYLFPDALGFNQTANLPSDKETVAGAKAKGLLAFAAVGVVAAGGAVVRVIEHEPGAASEAFGARLAKSEGREASTALAAADRDLSDEAVRGAETALDPNVSALQKIDESVEHALEENAKADAIDDTDTLATQQTSSLIDQSKPSSAVLHDSSAASLANIDSTIKRGLVDGAVKLAKDNPQSVKFEVLTGKLTVSSSFKKGGVEVSGGEVNLYKVATVLTAAVIACRKIADPDAKACVDTAFDSVKSHIGRFELGEKSGGQSG